MVTACVLKAEGKVDRVGILDCDQHNGDGTAGIIKRLDIDWINHITAVDGYPRKAEPFLDKLPEIMCSFSDCDLLLYQAGADPHIKDPLGGFLTTEQLAKRDRVVFALAHEMEIPLVWNLAGGYQDPAFRIMEIHRNTMMACISEYVS
jgi:acetoin utilization deacetylase AcuC-like enzyme